jgi:hypothetical protein
VANPCTKAVPAPCTPAISDARVLDNFTRRFNTATRRALVSPPSHPVNGDLELDDKCGTYSKGVQQASPGKVNLAAFAKFATAIANGKFADFQVIPRAPGASDSHRLNGPMGAYAKAFLGADSSLFGAPSVPAPPAVASEAYATELVELYWCSLLRDITFADYAANATAQAAAAELSALPDYAGPKDAGKVTAELLFRGKLPGEEIGPYMSQFLITPTNLGALPFNPRYVTYRRGVDYMTDLDSWYKVQQGVDTGYTNQTDAVPRFLHNGRGLAAYTHVDELYQAYLTAYLVLSSLGAKKNPGNPYNNSKTQMGFGTFGGPDVAAVLAQVAKYALNAVWYQKWVVHLRHRPEAGAGMVHLIKTGAATFDATPNANVFDSDALAASHAKYGTYLLSQPFPEGSPTHPAYPTGHGTVGGACITVLKFFFDKDFTFTGPQMANYSGTALVPWTGQPGTGKMGDLKLNGELHKLAHNITFAHGLHGGIHWRSDSDSSIELGEAVAISFLHDLVCTYEEPFKITITKLDGSTETFTNA